MDMTIEEILFLNSVAKELQEMTDSNEILERLDRMKKEYVELLDKQ